MCTEDFNDVAKVRGYHVHIYFKPQADEWQAERLMEEIVQRFPDAVESASKIGAIGPHLSSNYAVHIGKEGFAEIVQWLQLNGRGFSILIHPETEDGVKDHLESAMWLGKQLGLNQALFDQFKARKLG